MFREIFFLHHFIPSGVEAGAGAAKIEEPGAGAAKNGRLRNTGFQCGEEGRYTFGSLKSYLCFVF